MSSVSSNAGQSQAWANAAQRSEGVPPSVDAQLTEGERQALIAIRSKVRYAQRAGNVGGAALIYYWMHVRNRGKYSLASKVGFTVMGSLFAGAMAMPLGVMWGQSDVKSRVESPDHFKKVLEDAVRTRQAGRVAGAGGSSRPNQGSIPTVSSTPPPRSASDSSSGTQQQDPTTSSKTNRWGDESFDETALYANNQSAESYDRAGMTSMSGTSSFGSSTANKDHPEKAKSAEVTRTNSRWAEIRGERGGRQQSSWDRIRNQGVQQQASQDEGTNARQITEGRSDVFAPASVSSVGAADPAFGKGFNPQRAQAQRDYEASFERERRGMDG